MAGLSAFRGRVLGISTKKLRNTVLQLFQTMRDDGITQPVTYSIL